ncbi:hypothetical protein L2E82_26999 [Cichorium intybus]|uniref:Uncharacterized protein n=1 Tax=Cichorium intybus TaxID=13427 RepID=A0ACB9CSE9_CICIN|nr:hypothetical protein L2E82_26999 [Cichorium intybus]
MSLLYFALDYWIVESSELVEPDGMVKKVHNTDSNGSPFVRFKNLKDIYKAEDAMLQDGYHGTKNNNISTANEHTNLPFADRKTKERNSYIIEEDQPESLTNEDSCDKLTISQFMKKSKRKKRKASESLSTPKTDYDDSDLSQPLFKFRVKAPKISPKKIPVNESLLEFIKVKVEEASEVEYFECRESFHKDEVDAVYDVPTTFIASESGVIFVNDEFNSKKSEFFTNEVGICGVNKVSLDNSDDTKNNVQEITENVNQTPSVVEEDLTTSTSDYSQSQLTPNQVNCVSDVQDSDSTIDDVVCMEARSPLMSANDDADLNSLNSDNESLLPSNHDSEVNMSNCDYKTDIMSEVSEDKNSHDIEILKPERLPSTRKAISPTSQEKLCMAMKSTELLDDMDHYKCKEKLSFEEQPENKFSSANSDIEYNEPNVHLQQQQGKAAVLMGPGYAARYPRLSTGCTTVQGCSESAIAFSQRQMHDIESLASKLMSELNSMKAIVEEKLLFEAYRSPSLKNEADEVKTAIKTATKTEETAKKWLSMMARDCSRFCKIMKQNEDKDKENDTSSSGSGDAGMIEEKAVQRERKKISFADEAGGTLCDIKVYEVDQTSLDLKESPLE